MEHSTHVLDNMVLSEMRLQIPRIHVQTDRTGSFQSGYRNLRGPISWPTRIQNKRGYNALPDTGYPLGKHERTRLSTPSEMLPTPSSTSRTRTLNRTKIPARQHYQTNTVYLPYLPASILDGHPGTRD